MSAPVNILSTNPAFGWSPISRRYIKRDGAVYKRLVFAGVVVDPEVSSQLERSSGPPKQRVNNVIIPDAKVATRIEASSVGKDTATARKAAKKLIAAHVDELEGLPPDQVEAILRQLLATKLGAAPVEGEAPYDPPPRPGRATATPSIAPPPETPAPAGRTIRVKVATPGPMPQGRPRPTPAARKRTQVRDIFSTSEADTEDVSNADYSD